MMPHIVCFLRNWQLAVIHSASDFVIFVAYVVIGSALIHFRTRLMNALGRRIFLLFSVFIPLCGLTHLLDALVIWWPLYWIQAVVKIMCALISVQTAWLLVRLYRVQRSFR